MAAVDVIQATLAPAFLVTGSSIFLNFTQARLFRVIDRMRALAKEGQLGADQRQALLRRGRLLRNAIALGVLTVALTVVTSILLMAGQLWENPGLDRLAPGAFAVGMLTLLAALALTLADTVLSVRMAEREPSRP